MRGIIWKLKRFEYEDTKLSTRPKGISKQREFKKKINKFKDIICVHLCIEVGDKKEYLDLLKKRLLELNVQFYHLNKVVVLPFGHLSNNLEKPETAVGLLNIFADLLKKEGFEVCRVSFGTHKWALWEIAGNVADASYFEFPYKETK